MAQAVLLTADSVVAAASRVLAAPAAGPALAAPRAVLLVVAAPPLFLLHPAMVVATPPTAVAATPPALFLFLLPLLLDRVEPDGPRRPLCDRGSLDFLDHRTGVLRKPVTAGPVTYSDRIPLDPDRGGSGAPSCS